MNMHALAAVVLCGGLFGTPAAISAAESLMTLNERNVVMVVDSTGKTVGRALDTTSLSEPEVYVAIFDGPKSLQLLLRVYKNFLTSPYPPYYTTDDCTGTPYFWSRYPTPDPYPFGQAEALLEQAAIDTYGDVYVPAANAPTTVTIRSAIENPGSPDQHCNQWGGGQDLELVPAKGTTLNVYDIFTAPFRLQLRTIGWKYPRRCAKRFGRACR